MASCEEPSLRVLTATIPDISPSISSFTLPWKTKPYCPEPRSFRYSVEGRGRKRID
jgi:hypothetical protein